MTVFSNEVAVRLQDTDAAGILFFANQFIYAHETYEMLMEEIGLSFKSILDHENYLIPLVHAESNYYEPLSVGQRLSVELSVENIGDTSFTLSYKLKSADGIVVGDCRTVHVTINSKSGKKIPLPAKLRDGLERFSAE